MRFQKKDVFFWRTLPWCRSESSRKQFCIGIVSLQPVTNEKNTRFSQYLEKFSISHDMFFLLQNLSSFYLVFKMVYKREEAML